MLNSSNKGVPPTKLVILSWSPPVKNIMDESLTIFKLFSSKESFLLLTSKTLRFFTPSSEKTFLYLSHASLGYSVAKVAIVKALDLFLSSNDTFFNISFLPSLSSAPPIIISFPSQ
ncbi:hypothetical protein D3C73_1268080 [compost metagenome]